MGDGGISPGVGAIETNELTKRFGSLTALDRLTLRVERGEVFGFLGPNGAGKTTTLRLLLGFLRPSGGSARILGTDVADVRAVHRRVAFVPGDVSLWPKLTGEESLRLLANLRGGVDEAYRATLVERFELDLTKRSRTYSKGNRQKVALVAAFATRADVLLLDEPTAGLDPLMEREFQRCVAEALERGQTIFLSSHLLTEVEQLCTRVGILRLGTLVEVATIEKLRSMHNAEMELDLDGEAPNLSGVPGVGAVTATPAGIRIQLTGPPGPLLRAIAGLPVQGIRSKEASLEEIFLAYYGSGADGRPLSDGPA
jgi:ABC-2 type transport system ATP-binding protein